MKKSQILRKAKAVLARNIYELDHGSRQFVCHAVDWVSNGKDAHDILKDIYILLGEHHTVSSWLHVVHNVDKQLLTNENMMVYRHRWIDHLITRYEARGE